MSHLRLLPLDIIAHYLPTGSLALLFATLDKSLIFALSKRNTIDHLTFYDDGAPFWANMMLFKAVERVNRLEIVFHATQEPLNWSGFERLNPQELSLVAGTYHRDIASFYDLLAMGLPNEHLTTKNSPRFATLFPALTSLHIQTAVYGDYFSEYNDSLNVSFLPIDFILAMPPTLTILRLEHLWNFGTSQEIYALPTSITDLYCNYDYSNTTQPSALFNIAAALKHLQNLTRLTLLNFAYLGLELNYRTEIREFYGIHEDDDYLFDRLTGDVSPPLSFPPSLTELTLSDYKFSFPYQLLTSSSLIDSSLTRLFIKGSFSVPNADEIEFQPIDWANILPRSLTSLHLEDVRSKLNPFLSAKIKSLPTSLTDLTYLVAELFHDSLELMTPLICLESLRLRALFEGSPFTWNNWDATNVPDLAAKLDLLPVMELHQLPSSLKSLILQRAAPKLLTIAELQQLPSGLESLTLPRFKLSELDLVKKHLPNLFISFTTEVILTDNDNGPLLRHLFADEISPDLNTARLERAVRHWCEKNQVGFPFSLIGAEDHENHDHPFIQTTSLELNQIEMNSFDPEHYSYSRDLGVRMRQFRYFPHLLDVPFPNVKSIEARFLSCQVDLGSSKSPPPTLTALHLHTTSFINVFDLPPTLTILTSEAPGDIHEINAPSGGLNPLRLKHLRAPRWRCEASSLLRILDPEMDTLETQIVNLPDYEVLFFLTKLMTPHNVLISKITLQYSCTGTLVQDLQFSDGKADLGAMKISTTNSLLERINAATCTVPSSFALNIYQNTSKHPSEAVISLSSALGDRFQLNVDSDSWAWVIPSHTRSFTLEDHHRLIPDFSQSHLPDDRDLPLVLSRDIYIAEPSLPNLTPSSAPISLYGPIVSLLTRLIHLEIGSNACADRWWNCLPDQLLTLIVRSNDPNGLNIGNKFPCSLTALVIERQTPSVSKLSFRLSSLPRSLKYLAIHMEPIELCDILTECKEDISLPNLKSMYLSRPTELTALSLCKMLPKISGIRILGISTSPKTTEDLAGKLAALNCRQLSEALLATNNGFAKLKIPKFDMKALLLEITESESMESSL